MFIKQLTIGGFRGFKDATSIQFAIPDKKKEGSGLTILVGPNNSGKSSIIEAVNYLISNSGIIPKQSRNCQRDSVEIKLEFENGSSRVIKSSENGGAYILKYEDDKLVGDNWMQNNDIFVLSGKRSFSSTFSNPYARTRNDYKGNVGDDYRREVINSEFGGRLMQVLKNKQLFDECLGKVLNPIPNWTVEASDNDGNVYLEFDFNGVKHSSKGSGDGYINIFNIIDALYDSKEDNVIFIDEPEISLHPDLQKRLFTLLKEYSKDKQIIISTHSPYFIDLKMIVDTSKLLRLKKVDNEIKIFEMRDNTRKDIKGIVNDNNNINKILSLDTRSVFFLDDNIILVEGQDDVIGYKTIFNNNNLKLNASFFGWGMGGANNAAKILNVLNDLGYSKVFTIFDNDQKELVSKCEADFPNYKFYAIVADDIRNKKDKEYDLIINLINENKYNLTKEFKEKLLKIISKKIRNKNGLLESLSNYEINKEHIKEYTEDIERLIGELKSYFSNNESINISNGESKPINTITLEPLSNEYIDYIRSKCSNFDLEGGSCLLSKKELNGFEHEYVEVGCTLPGSKNDGILIIFETIRSLRSGNVKWRCRYIKSNTLPINRFKKIYLNIRLKYDL